MVLCFVLRDLDGRREVLLGRKKRGFGTGKVVGLGGHLPPGETDREAAVREVSEESGLLVDPGDLLAAGGLLFTFPARPEWDMHTTVFVTTVWAGVPVETEEIAPEWYGVAALPVDSMWSDAATWIPMCSPVTRSAARSCTGTTTSRWPATTCIASGPSTGAPNRQCGHP